MKWIKHVIIDLAIACIIVLWTFGLLPDAWKWVIYLYTPLITAIRLLALTTGLDRIKQTSTGHEPPGGFYHLLFVINISCLAYYAVTYRHVLAGVMAGLWLLTWILSSISERRKRGRL